MARRPKIRVSFGEDRGYLIRLRQAIEDDGGLSLAWKRDAILSLTRLEQLFLTEDLRRLTVKAG